MDRELAYIDKVKEWFVVNGSTFVVDVIVVLIIMIIGKVVIKWVCKSSVCT